MESTNRLGAREGLALTNTATDFYPAFCKLFIFILYE